jgi:hypothetical protein
MSDQAFIRVAVPADLRERYKTACLELGMSMGDQAALLFRAFVEGQAGSAHGLSSRTTSTASGFDESGSEVLPLIDEIRSAMEAQSRKLLGAIQPSTLRFTELERLVRHGSEANEKRISQASENWRQDVAGNNAHWRAQLARERGDRRWLGGAFGAGMVALSLLLWATSGTGIGRSLATGLAGGETRWQSALLLAGDGSELHAALMNETAALLKFEPFRDGFETCVARAKRARAQPISCKLIVSPLVAKQ